jgi:pyruvate/2-oxoglutarate dehydrogenase complex dihydrolipoamide dehydrogenase (E3) component
MREQTVDVVVIGAGAVGENVAGTAVAGGLSVVLVESELVGGECSYWACMPSKALLRPGEALETVHHVPGAAQAVTGGLDQAGVLAWRDKVTSNWDDSGQVDWVKGAGIELARGHARITGVRQVDVEPADGKEGGGPGTGAGTGGLRLTARHAVVVATGSVPIVPPVTGLAQAPYWTSRDATSSHEIPRRLVVLGGGVVGVEMAQAYRSLGAEVTLVAGAGLLAKNEPFAGELVQKSLEAAGVTVRTQVEMTEVRHQDDTFVVTLADGSTLEADRLLLGTGRRPNTFDLGLEAFGFEAGKAIEIDDSGRAVAVPDGWLYAAGDVNGRAMLTHQGKYQARVIGDVLAARAKGTLGDTVEPWSRYAMTADTAAVPQVVFTLPQVASVGLTVAQAQEKYRSVRPVEIPIAVAGGSVLVDNYSGRAVLVIDEDRKVVVGATFVGPGVSELLHSATIAVVGEVPLDRLWHAVPSYPTLSEVWLRLLEAYGL